MWPNVINTGSPLFRGDWTQDYDLSSIPHRRIKSSKNILRPIRHRLRRARRTQSDLLSVLTMHRLASPERVDRVSNGLHRICIAFQVALNWSVTSASVSVEPEKQRSSHCLFPMSWSYMNVCRGGGQELDCAAETASPLMPASGESHTGLFHIFIEIKKGESVSPWGLLSPSGFSHFGDATLMWQGPHQVSKTSRSVHTTLLSRLSRCSGVRRARSLCSCLWRSAACHAGCSFYCSWAALAGWSTSTKWEVDRRAPSCEWWRSLGGHCPGCLQCPGKTRGCQFRRSTAQRHPPKKKNQSCSSTDSPSFDISTWSSETSTQRMEKGGLR